MIIAVDFDGTCVTHDFPKVGKNIGAAIILKRLTECGHQLILHTMRSTLGGVSPLTKTQEKGGLEDAVNWFKENNIPLFGINENPTQNTWTSSPKPYAVLYIDDAALGCPLKHIPEFHPRPFADWLAIELWLREKGFFD